MKVVLGGDIELPGVTAISVELNRDHKLDGTVQEFRTVATFRVERTLTNGEAGKTAHFSALATIGQPAEIELTFTRAGEDVCTIELADVQVTSVHSNAAGDELREILAGSAGVMRMSNPSSASEFVREPPLFSVD